ncbi:hypothetical protein CR513_22575, partial [Mucuna pruriens]
MNATRDANTEEHMITLETGKANPFPASNCPVGAISESCATMLVTQNMAINITAIKISAASKTPQDQSKLVGERWHSILNEPLTSQLCRNNQSTSISTWCNNTGNK